MPLPLPQLNPGPLAGTTPGLHLWWRAVGRAWLTLALASTLIGLGWRFTGGAPDLALALDGAGLALWFCAWPLADALVAVRARQAHYGRRLGGHWRCRAVTALHLWAAAACLALAPAGLLLGYHGRTTLLVLETLDPYTIGLTSAIVYGVVLALAGPAAVAVSTLLLAWARRGLGGWAGSLVWLALALMAHWPLLAGPEAVWVTGLPLRLTPLGAPFVFNLPQPTLTGGIPIGLGLGQYAHDVLRMCQQSTQQAGRYAYLEDLLQRVAVWPVSSLLIALSAWLGLSALPVKTCRLRLAPAWPATVSLLTVGLMQLALTAQWQAQPELRFPTPLLNVFTVGLAVMWLAYAVGLIFTGDRPRLGFSEAAWTVLAAAGWLALTLPQLAAGQASVVQAATLAGLAATLGLAGQSVLARLARLVPDKLGGYLALAGALILALPLTPAGSLSAQILMLLSTGWADPELTVPLAWLAGSGVALALACWPWPRWRRGEHQRAA